MADEVESAFDDEGNDVDLSTPRELWVLLVAMVLVAAILLARSV